MKHTTFNLNQHHNFHVMTVSKQAL